MGAVLSGIRQGYEELAGAATECLTAWGSVGGPHVSDLPPKNPHIHALDRRPCILLIWKFFFATAGIVI